ITHTSTLPLHDALPISDAYALIKVLSRDRGVRRIQVLANQVHHPNEGKALFAKLERVTAGFLDVTLNYLGAVPRDEWLRRAVQRQEAVVEAFPSSPSARAFVDIARRARQWQSPSGPRGHIEFFTERLVAQPGSALARASPPPPTAQASHATTPPPWSSATANWSAASPTTSPRACRPASRSTTRCRPA